MALVKTFCMAVKDACYTSAKPIVRKPDYMRNFGLNESVIVV